MATLVINAAIIVTQNGLLSHGRCFAAVKSTHGMIKVRLNLSRPLTVEPGQYINLWIPSASFWAFTQAHPFVVISWEEVPQTALDLFIQPRRGFTRNVASLASPTGQPSSWWAVFGGPYGQILETYGFEKVLMVANGAGIAAQIPFLRKLIHGYHARQAFTRRVHLVWHIHDRDIGIAAETMLNEALDEDKLASGGVSCSVHVLLITDVD
ncbi:uncharacterized protein HMPREF1541_10428 [Cyphellophora europaea CBS 101466]|uniref:ferric-chelate reductase (NADPH) n=1 Tax=Cyphellophora europaea (strain CBS 101466) TaxID=1220924 RepID=W2S9P2_CYPE1|nr:uncharacterized protein HMPREF1541_10428 [Cyphellophora europaea CBS 101466]ETN44758.1 hypothetical protein HMPREF1541_10428 [Cyphellophora europaea CBS 101466]